MPLMAIFLVFPAIAALATWVWPPNNEPAWVCWMDVIQLVIALLVVGTALIWVVIVHVLYW